MTQKLAVDGFVQSFLGRFCTTLDEFPIETTLDLPDQRSIALDVSRTKSDILTPSEKQDLETLLTYYCKANNHTYKQGMNEILVPFLLLSRHGVPKHVLYTCFCKFIEMFLSTLFYDDHFKPLTGLFHISKLVLLYHFPEIYKRFETHQITPDMYMASWFITMFASKIRNLDILYMFWHKLVQIGEVFYLSYFGIAMLGYYKDLILAHDPIALPNVFKDLIIKDFDDFKAILSAAEELRANIPYTTEWVLKKYEIFKLDKSDYFSNALEQLPCLIILPRDIINLTYPHQFVCQCMDAKTCSVQHLKIVLIDCRSTNETKKGKLLNSEQLPDDARNSQTKLRKFLARFEGVKKSFHFSLLVDLETEEERSRLRELLAGFLGNGFARVSVVEGGYVACHDFAMQHGLPILKHSEKKCGICFAGGKRCNRSWLGVRQIFGR